MMGTQFTAIIEEKFKTLPIQEVADVFVDKVEADSNVGIDPTGKAYTPYAKATRKSGPVRLRDKSRGIETADTLYAQAMEARVGFTGSSGYGGSSKPTGEVMNYHHYGTAKGGKERKVFLNERDITSSGGQQAVQRVEAILEAHFNE